MLQEATQSFTQTQMTPTTSSKSRSGRSQKNNDDSLDNGVLSTVATSLTKLVEHHTTAQPGLKFKEFHDELDKLLSQLPFMEALKLSMEIMQRANDFVKTFTAQQTFENMGFD